MRLFATIGVLGGVLGALASTAGLQAQSLAEHGAAAAGATIGTAAGKPMSDAVTKIFGQVDNQAKSAGKADIKKSPMPPATTTATPSPASAGPAPDTGFSGGGGGGGAASAESAEKQAAASARRAARLRRQRESATAAIESPAALPPPVIAPPPIVIVKEPTPEQVAGIQIGANETDVLATLGVPASRVTVPDDDGHLRESYQYWAKGSQIGTVRLDNGVVVKVETRRY